MRAGEDDEKNGEKRRREKGGALSPRAHVNEKQNPVPKPAGMSFVWLSTVEPSTRALGDVAPPKRQNSF
jgi:hypothetical protein